MSLMLTNFSPLFIGESSLTAVSRTRAQRPIGYFSPLFIGESSLTSATSADPAMLHFSPLFIGESSLTAAVDSGGILYHFSPLFIGESSLTRSALRLTCGRDSISVPSSSGSPL